MKGIRISFDWRTSAVHAAIARIAGYDVAASGRHVVQADYGAADWWPLATAAVFLLRRGYVFCFQDGWLQIDCDTRGLGPQDFALVVQGEPDLDFWLGVSEDPIPAWIAEALSSGDLPTLLGGPADAD